MGKLTQMLLPCFLMGAFASQVIAQSECSNERESPPAVWQNERNLRSATAAWELLSAEQYAEAEAEFQTLSERFRDDYERSQALFGLGQARMALDRVDDALTIFEQIIELDALPNKSHFDAMFQMAGLFYVRDRYDDALRWIQRWQREACEERIEIYELLASIHASRDEFRDALSNINRAIAMIDKPKESHYQIKLGMHYELKEFPEVADTLALMVRHWPDKKQYWVQLSSINVTLKRDEEALAVLALAHRKGLLEKQQDWLQLYSLYAYLDLPARAAEVLHEGLQEGIVESTQQHWEQLGSAWHAAQELDRAIDALKQAATLSADGKIDRRVAYIMVDKEDWPGAKQAAAAALAKGGLSQSQVGELQVMLGMSELQLGDHAAARRAFLDARSYPDSQRTAQEWLNHLEQLEKRQDSP